jgi:tetratricopeptide (TPR) repeat protein
VSQQNHSTGKKQRRPSRGDPGMEWNLEGLEDWTTDAIIAKLRELGVDVDAERFVQQAREAGGFEKLIRRWIEQLSADKRDTLWEDFPWMAVEVLWPRLAGDVICADLIEQRVYRVLEAQDERKELPDVKGLPADLAAGMEVMDFLERFPVEERAAKFDEFDNGRFYDYAEWLLQLVWEDGMHYPEQATRIADVMVDCRRGAEFQGHLAGVLMAIKRRDEAVARTEQNLARFGEDPWAKILAGDVYDQDDQPGRALGLWKEAMAMTRDASVWDSIADRLEEVARDEQRAEEVKAILAEHPRPPEEKKKTEFVPPAMDDLELPPMSELYRDEPIAPLTRAKVVGRNDPCPCGSGKKYKKCCMP